jgi:hypothetical protein
MTLLRRLTQHHRSMKRKHHDTKVKSTSPTKKASGLLSTTVFRADRNATVEATNDATKQSNWVEKDSRIGPTRARAVCTSTIEAILYKVGNLIKSGRIPPQVRRLWAGQVPRGKWAKNDKNAAGDAKIDYMPFICHESYKFPIVIRCGYLFWRCMCS